MRDGAIAFLKKPFSDEDLLAAIRAVLDPRVN
jgi:FixJ family two-component response regulator